MAGAGSRGAAAPDILIQVVVATLMAVAALRVEEATQTADTVIRVETAATLEAITPAAAAPTHMEATPTVDAGTSRVAAGTMTAAATRAGIETTTTAEDAAIRVAGAITAVDADTAMAASTRAVATITAGASGLVHIMATGSESRLVGATPPMRVAAITTAWATGIRLRATSTTVTITAANRFSGRKAWVQISNGPMLRLRSYCFRERH
jgi:hypothetical protein